MIPLPTSVELRAEHEGKRVEKVLLRELAGIRESFLLFLIHRGKVRLDGRVVARGERVPGVGRVDVEPAEPRAGPAGPVANAAIALHVLHEDAAIIVLEKAAGIAMHPGPQHGSDTLQNGLVARYPELLALTASRGFGLVQRLDRDVSGVVVVARTAKAHAALVEQFAGRRVDKRYRALVRGSPKPATGSVATPVEARDARSEWQVLERAGSGESRVSLVALHALTGRKHQLRIHMATLGCPILGDRRYGKAAAALSRTLGLERVALHAAALTFEHPDSKEKVHFTAPWPPALEAAWQQVKSSRGGTGPGPDPGP